MTQQLTRLNRFERNPFRPDVPESFMGLSKELYDYLREIAETLREQHNLSQAGDSTYSWELLTYVDSMAQFKTGSTGRFYHPSYGIILARYCRFSGMRDSENLGPPIGICTDGNPLSWSVTNDLTRSRADLCLGVLGAYTLPSDGNFGWVITNGVNIQDLLYANETAPSQFDKLSWVAGDAVGNATTTQGRTIASVLGVAAWVGADDVWVIPAGYAFINVQCESQAVITSWINEIATPIVQNLTLLANRVSALEGDAGLAGLRVRVAACEAGINTNAQAIAAQSRAYSISLTATNRRLEALEAAVAAGAGSTVDTVLRNDFNAYVDMTNLRLTTLEGKATLFASQLSGLTAFQVSAESQLSALLDSINTTNLSLNGLRASIGVVGFTTYALDADTVIAFGIDSNTLLLSGAITADRALTLTGGVAGGTIRITRTGTGAFNWNIGIGPLKALAVNTWCDLGFDGANWKLTAYGAL